MNPFVFAKRRPITALILVLALVGGGILGLSKMGIEVLPPPYARKMNAGADRAVAAAKQMKGYIVARVETYFNKHEEEVHHEQHKIVVTSPKKKDVTITQQYVCQIHSQRHIEVRALESGYLEQISVREGQLVKKGDLMFKIVPTLYQAKLDAELAEAQLAQLEFNNAKRLSEDSVVSKNEVALVQARLAKAKAMADLAGAELNFTNVKAPFEGIVDRLQEQLGSLINEGDVLTTLSDNSVMWVYFNMPERGYLEYMADLEQHKDERIELLLANGEKFQYPGAIGAIEAKFNNETGNIPFRADFPNPKGLLRHGQTGTVLISRVSHDAVVIPQRSTFENLAKRYIYVLDKDNVVHQREITVENELEDVYVIKPGKVDVGEKIVLEGIRQVRDGEEVEYEYREPDEVLANPKFKAE